VIGSGNFSQKIPYCAGKRGSGGEVVLAKEIGVVGDSIRRRQYLGIVRSTGGTNKGLF